MPAFQIHRLAVVSIQAQDVPLTVHFYQEVIGLKHLAHHGHRPAFDLGNDQYLVIVEGTEGARPAAREGGFPALAFAVDDLDQAVEHLRRHQVDLPWGVQGNQQARWVEFYDPGGNLIELAQFAG